MATPPIDRALSVLGENSLSVIVMVASSVSPAWAPSPKLDTRTRLMIAAGIFLIRIRVPSRSGRYARWPSQLIAFLLASIFGRGFTTKARDSPSGGSPMVERDTLTVTDPHEGEASLMRRLGAEFIGALLLVAVGAGAVVAFSQVTAQAVARIVGASPRARSRPSSSSSSES